MSEFREIYVKAVCGRSRHAFHDTNILHTEWAVDEILGCRVTNHQFAGTMTSAGAQIHGHYDVHVWFTHSGGQNTTVLTKTVDYTRAVSFEELGIAQDECEEPEATVRLTHGPICSDGILVGGSAIQITVDVGYLVEVVGNTKLCVKHYPGACGDDDKKDYIDLLDEEQFDEAFLEDFEDEEDLVS